ncbi:MAG: stage II sporulation protein P, partial [Syntrophomonadaceae bacterium]|nr:stage II sporulation protein P [Syntrophomonadaceae bacterium]
MRDSISRRRIWILGFLLALGMLVGFYYSGDASTGWGQLTAAPVFNPLGYFSYEEERTDGGYFVLIDEQGRVLDETSRRIYPGDEYISENNSHYQVKRVEGEVARCILLGVEELAADSPVEEEAAVPAVAGAAVADKPLVGIYNTHGGESYVPNQGVSSVRGKGGITEVAASLADRLKSQGISAIYDNTSHVPNDRSSYRRSRRTVASLMKQGARFLIDVHRDAAPAAAYVTKIGGKNVARIKLVVGRQNPQQSAVLGLAKQMKAQMDKLH